MSAGPPNRRVLIIDDNRAIHEDFAKILGGGAASSAALAAMEEALFDEAPAAAAREGFELSSAFQGRDGFEMVKRAEEGGTPFAMAFVDVRMPPGWDGVETIERIWEVSKNLQTVICTAYSDYSWDEVHARLGETDRLVILRKPFEPEEVQGLASKLVEKWSTLR